MADITFTRVSDDVKAKADQDHTLGKRVSPFLQNVVFQITGFTYTLVNENGKVKKDAKPNPVFTIKIGDKDAELYVHSLNRDVPLADGGTLEHTGTFNLFVRDFINEHSDKSDGEILTAIVEKVKDRKLIVNRVPYVRLDKFSNRQATSLVDINFKVD